MERSLWRCSHSKYGGLRAARSRLFNPMLSRSSYNHSSKTLCHQTAHQRKAIFYSNRRYFCSSSLKAVQANSNMSIAPQVVHMVWFKTKAPLKAEDLSTIKAKANELKNIPGVISVEIGENFTDRSRGFNLGLFVRLQNKEALNLYSPHPIHQQFVSFISEYRDEVMALDFESTP